MTAGEALLIDAIRCAPADPHAAHGILADIAATPDCLGALTTAQAVAAAFLDGGRALA